MKKNPSQQIIRRVWNYAHVLKDDGLAFMDYTEQITYLLFLKLASESNGDQWSANIPARYMWSSLKAVSDDRSLWQRYHQGLRKLSERPGLLGLIFTKPQSKINDPAKLRLLINMIDKENWADLDIDVKGEIYEGLLARNAEDVRGGAGQYFTPRPVVRAIVKVMRPSPMMRIADPACGTGGFLLEAYDQMRISIRTAEEDRFSRHEALHGSDLVPNVARLCAMNLYLHGLGSDDSNPLVSIVDSLAVAPEKYDMVLTNPPFGKRSSIRIIGENGKKEAEDVYYERGDFWATTKNKQLNFLQHVWSMLNETGRAAIVVPDNVLFEGGAGERIRRNLLTKTEVHTLLRLPTGIWYSPGVKANVLFFDRRLSRDPNARDLWVYDLRTNQRFTPHENKISFEDMTDFIYSYNPMDRAKRSETERFRRFPIEAVLASERASLDITWLSQESFTRSEELPKPHALAQTIITELESAMREFSLVETSLRLDD